MSENLRDQMQRALKEAWRDRAMSVSLDVTWRAVTDAAWGVVGPELDRLRAEVERSEASERLAWDVHREHVDAMGPIIARHAGDATFARIRADKAEAERDDLRARLAKAQIELRDGLADESLEATGVMERALAALASVPEPSDSEPDLADIVFPRMPKSSRVVATFNLDNDPSDSEPACTCATTESSLVRCPVHDEHSEPAPEPHRDAQDGLNGAPRSPRSPEGVSGAQRGAQRFEPDADREAGERRFEPDAQNADSLYEREWPTGVQD